MYDLYIANKNYSSWSLRPWVLMRELSIRFSEKLVPFVQGPSRTAFRAFSPSGRVPCLHDQGVVVWDSLAIVEYLAERHRGVWPADSRARAWSRSAAAEIHSGFQDLRSACSMNCGLRVRLHAIQPGLQQDLDRIAEIVAEGLQKFGGPFLAGPAFTAVDAFFAPVAFRVQTYGLALDEAAAAWVQRQLALASMTNWYADALREPWREQGREDEARQAGAVSQDLRADVA